VSNTYEQENCIISCILQCLFTPNTSVCNKYAELYLCSVQLIIIVGWA